MASIKRDGGRPFDAPILRDTTICPKHILWNNGSSTCTFENCFLRTKHKQFDSSKNTFLRGLYIKLPARSNERNEIRDLIDTEFSSTKDMYDCYEAVVKRIHKLLLDIHPDTSSDDDSDEEMSEQYCTCRGSDDGTGMIQCDGCEEWYHGRCIGIEAEMLEDIQMFLCQACRVEEEQKFGIFDIVSEPPASPSPPKEYTIPKILECVMSGEVDENIEKRIVRRRGRKIK